MREEKLGNMFGIVIETKELVGKGVSVERIANGISKFLRTYKEGMEAMLSGY
jgi:hypothetical protein